MRSVLATIVVSLILLVAAGAAFIFSGAYDVAAIHPDNPLVARLVHLTSDRAVAARLDSISVPEGLDRPDTIAAGAKLYGQTCVVCHGGPGVKASDIAQGLNPTPPNLFRAGRKPDPKETDWFISNGVKMTGMPGFSKTLSQDQIWSLVAFLNTAPGMSTADFSAKTGVPVTTDAQAATAGD